MSDNPLENGDFATWEGGVNLLANPSFELGWRDDGNRQIPDGWRFWYAPSTQTNPHPDGWSYQPPEMRVLAKKDIPQHEWDLFFVDGDQMVKIFAPGAWFGWLYQLVDLEAGQYRLTVPAFADAHTGIVDGAKVPATDPNSALIQVHTRTIGTTSVPYFGEWRQMTPFLQRNVYEFEFDAPGGPMLVGARFQYPWAIKSTAVFTDAWTLDPAPEPSPCRGTPRVQYKRTYVLTHPDDFDEIATAAAWALNDQDLQYTIGRSADDAGIGDLDYRRVIIINPALWPNPIRDFFAEHYPGVIVETITESVATEVYGRLKRSEFDEPPDPDPQPLPDVIKTTFHLQRPFDGWLDVVRRAADAGRPFWWIKIVQEGLEIIEQVRRYSPTTNMAFRYIPSEQPAFFLDAADPFEALDNSSFAPMFDRAVALGYDLVETPINEVIGTHDEAGTRKAVTFDVAYAEWCYRRSGGHVAPGIINPGGGNPDHGVEETWLIPAAQAAIEYGGYLMPHTYFPADPKPGVTERWIASGQAQYDFHLRPVLSWDVQFAKNGLKPRYIFGEAGAVGAYDDGKGNPAGYRSAGSGWRAGDCLAGNLQRYIALLVEQEALLQQHENVEAACVFTSGFVQWEYFQFNRAEWMAFLDGLGL